MRKRPTDSLTSTRGAALYIGALLGPSLLLLPGLAASLAGPASILAWVGMLVVSGLLAWVFTALGTRVASGGGVVDYAALGLGRRAGVAVGWCFLAGVVLGAPVVCLIGGTYVASLVGGGRTTSVVAAALLLVFVVAVTLGGARTTTTVQLGLVAALIALVVAAVAGSAHAARLANWTPFAPHGWTSIGSASAALMLSFVGWEAIASLTGRLPDARRQLPRIIAAAFVVTAVVYLALAAATVGVLGTRAGSAVPLADLLDVAVGPAGPAVAAVAAVVLTLGAANAYISGATALAARLRTARRVESAPHRGRRLQLGIAVAGVIVLGAVEAGLVDTAELVALPTALFLAVYLGCTTAAVRVLRGPSRVAAGAASVAVAVVLAFCGWGALVVPAVVVLSLVAALLTARPRRARRGGLADDAGPEATTTPTRPTDVAA